MLVVRQNTSSTNKGSRRLLLLPMERLHTKTWFCYGNDYTLNRDSAMERVLKSVTIANLLTINKEITPCPLIRLVIT